MRSPEEVTQQILQIAREDERIRAVLLNGSRADAHAPRDLFQDFDIVYLVDEVESFVADREWITRFGETLIVQTPETMDEPPPSRDGTFVYLMLFADGNRIDLTLCPLGIYESQKPDSLTLVLLDKDARLSALPPASDADYVPTAPAAKRFADCCNEFYWVSTNAAKGLWRGEIVYARLMIEQFMRPQAMRMLDWHIGLSTGFTTSPGKMGKRYRDRLPEALWRLVERSYSDADPGRSWAALHALVEAFRMASEDVAGGLGYAYPTREADNVTAYLRRVEALPHDVQSLD